MPKSEILTQALVCFGDPARRESYFDLYSDDIVLHGYQGVEPGLASVKAFYYSQIWAPFPDAAVLLEETLEVGDKLVVRFKMTGTHQGPFLGVPATGKAIVMPGITVLRFEAAKCVERWSCADFLGVLAQLGAFPPA